jgi:hypothetical protein
MGPLSDNEVRGDNPHPTLDRQIDGKGTHPSLDKEPAAHPDAHGDYQDRLALIKEYYGSYKQAIKDGEASLAISKREAAAELASLNDREITAIVEAGRRYRKALEDYYAKAVAQHKATPQDRDDAVKRFDASEVNTVKRLFDETEAARREGIVESSRIAGIETQNRLAMLKEEANQEIAIERDKYQQGYTTELDYLNKKEDIERRIYLAELTSVNNEIEALGLGTEKREQLQAQALLLEQKYTGQIDQNALTRIAAIKAEADAREKAADQIRAAHLESLGLALGIESDSSYAGHDRTGDEELYTARQKELELLIREKEASLDAAAAKNAESKESRALALELEQLYNQRLKDVTNRLTQVAKLVPDETLRYTIAAPIIRDSLGAAAADNQRASDSLAAFNKDHADDYSPEAVGQRTALEDAVARTAAELDQWNRILQDSIPTTDQALSAFATRLMGFDPFTAWTQAKKTDDNDGGITGYDHEIAVGAKEVAGAFKGIVDAAKVYQQGFEQGGVLGGTGALMGQFSSIGEMLLPGVGGAIMSAVGSIMQTIGGLFTQAVRDIANQIEKNVSNIMLQYSTQQLDLANTITQLQEQEAQAISSLSGTKGGQDQLNKILPSLEQQISSLQQQAKQTIATFDSMTANLELQNDTLSQINQQWQQIVQQVADYLSAGGSATTATQALSAELQKMQIDAQNSLHQANDQAVQDAINLNGLLQQRLNLTQQYNEQVFQVVNQGSIQRQQGAVTQGMQLAQLAAQYAQQLNDLDSQISLAQQKVAAESQIFTIAQNINDLHAQDAQLQMDALNYQLQQYQALQKIVAGITQDASGVFTAAPGLFNALPTTINIELNLAGYTLTATGTIAPGQSTPTGATGSLSDQLQWNLRQTLGIS